MSANKTSPRPDKTVKLIDKATSAPIVEAPAAEVVEPKGTSVPPAAETPAPESKAAGVLADEIKNDAPITVAATPTAAQLAARELQVGINKAWIGYMGAIPGVATAFAEPDDDQIDVMIEAYMAEHEGVRMTRAAFAIKEQIDNDRAAFEAAQQNVKGVKLEYYRAARAELLGFIATVDTLIVNAGGTPVKAAPETKERRAGGGGKSGMKWQDKAPALIKWAADNKLPGLFFIDKAEDGYKGVMHALKLHAGREDAWEICTVTTNGVPVGTGEFVKSPLYYNKEGKPIATDGGSIPNTGGPMRAFVVPTFDVVTPINASKGASATAKHAYVEPYDLFAALNLS